MARDCFVLMPFAPNFDGIWQEVIAPTVREMGDNCVRADDIFRPGSVMDDVLTLIRRADYLIADLTTRNPNVFYELGLAHALEKQVILLADDIAEVPFDVRHRRVIVYEDSALGIARLRGALKKAISGL